MALGNCELPHTDQSVHLAGGLVAEQRGGLVIAQRQVAVGAGFVEIRLILERAGHRAQGEHLVILLLVAQHEHAVFIMIPMAGNFVEITLRHKRRFRQQPAALLLLILHKALQNLNNTRALGQQDRQPLADHVGSRKELQLAAKLIVIAFFGLLQLR